MRSATNLVISRQRGFGGLAIVMILMFIISIVVLFFNRGVLGDLRTVGTTNKAIVAHQAAEAGIEWATGMLNTPYDITGDCSLLNTTNQSYRKKYVQAGAGTAISVATGVTSGCKMEGTTLHCACPNSGAAVSPNTLELPSFTISFAPVASDVEAVQVTAVGCAAQSGICSAATASNTDAVATITQTLKMRKLLRAAPAAPLTCGTSCTVGGSFDVINYDQLTNGVTVNSGTTTTVAPGGNVFTIPGQPYENSIVANDQSLSSLASADTTTCSNSNMFKAYFGSTLQEYAAAPQTKTISCGQANDCGSKVNSAMADGWRSFYFPDGFAWNNASGNLGSSTDPVTLVTPGQFDINGNITIHGMLFSNNGQTNALGTGTSNIIGAVVACRGFDSNGSGNITYGRDALTNLQRNTASLVRVPGSWRDWQYICGGTPC